MNQWLSKMTYIWTNGCRLLENAYFTHYC